MPRGHEHANLCNQQESFHPTCFCVSSGCRTAQTTLYAIDNYLPLALLKYSLEWFAMGRHSNSWDTGWVVDGAADTRAACQQDYASLG